jgi:DNA-nicking Smr family endonuclease
MGKRRIPEKKADEPIDSLLVKAVEEETDLHGLDSHGAEVRLESFLLRWASQPGAVIRVITGRGNRSDGSAVLKPLVGKLLTSKFSRYVQRHTLEPGGGSYLVQIK